MQKYKFCHRDAVCVWGKTSAESSPPHIWSVTIFPCIAAVARDESRTEQVLVATFLSGLSNWQRSLCTRLLKYHHKTASIKQWQTYVHPSDEDWLWRHDSTLLVVTIVDAESEFISMMQRLGTASFSFYSFWLIKRQPNRFGPWIVAAEMIGK